MMRWLLILAGLLLALPAHAGSVLVWHTMRGAEEQALEQVAERFTQQTGHTVRLVPLSFGAYDAKLETAIPRGNGPDVFIAAHGNLGKWTAMDLVQAVPEPPAGHRDVAVRALTIDERVWGQPLALKSLLLLVDPQQVPLDQRPTTTDQLVALADRLTTDEHYGLVYPVAVPYHHAAWMHGFGATALDAQGRPSLDSPGQVQALAFARELAERMPAQPDSNRVSALADQGRAAMIIDGPWAVADLDRPFVAMPLPTVSATGQPARPYLTVDAAFVAQGARDLPASQAFAAFLAGPVGADTRARVGDQAVTHTSIEPTSDLQRAQLAQAESAIPLPTNPDVQSAFEGLARALRQTLRGTNSPDKAASAAQTYALVLTRPPPAPASPWPYVGVLGVLVLGGLGLAGWRLSHAELRARIRAHLVDYAWVAPAALSLGLLVLVPFVTGAAVSLFAHDDGSWTFVGISHFLDILLARDWPVTSPMSFAFTLVVTVLWTVANVTLHVALGVALALLLREPWVRLRPLWRALLILPWAVPNYITALIWRTLFDAEAGAVNTILGLVLLQGDAVELDWFARFATGFAANLTTNTWLGFPFMMVVTLGALQSIPRDLEEAAEVDGASAWQRFRHVTWPMLQPALLPAVILGSVWTFNMFNVVYLVSAGEPDGSTEILISEAYRWAFSRGNRYGYAAAYAVLIFGVLLLYSRGANRLVGRKVL